MSTSTTKTKKQIGDRVVITGGSRKGIQGNIIALQGLKATLRTDDDEEIPAMLAWIDKIESTQPASETAETPNEPVEAPVVETTSDTTTEPPEPIQPTVSEPVTESSPTVSETAPIVKKRGRKPKPDAAPTATVQSEPAESTESAPTAETATVATESTPVAPKRTRKPKSNQASETAPESNVAQNPYEKMTVVELQNVAKERKISVARTKADFVRIIQQQEPDIDVTTLKGPMLFNKVSELHISRLRSKKDLVELLSN